MTLGTLITWSTTGTYLVHGHVTGFEYEDLPGVTVTVTNLRTNEDADATVDEDGEYGIDLGNTTDYPSGYTIGDELLISCTHRDATRTWKRRVAGSTLEQDVHFTHGTWLGALRKAKMVVLDPATTGNTGLTLTLGDAQTKGVLRVWKNGVLLDDSAWSFSAPITLTFTTPLLSSDAIEYERILRTTDEAKEVVVRDGDAPVRAATARYYSTPLPARVPDLQDLSENLAAAALRDRLLSGGTKSDSEAQRLRNIAQPRLDAIQNGKASLTDQDGAFITPTAQSTTTPRSSTTPTRRFSAWDREKVDL